MTENIENLVLEQLRHIRAAQARHDQKFEDVLSRLGHLERGVARLGSEFADFQAYSFGLAAKVDRMETRIDRIERRLEIID